MLSRVKIKKVTPRHTSVKFQHIKDNEERTGEMADTEHENET